MQRPWGGVGGVGLGGDTWMSQSSREKTAGRQWAEKGGRLQAVPEKVERICILFFLRWKTTPSVLSNRAARCGHLCLNLTSVPFSSVAQLCPTLCDPMDSSMPNFPVHHQLLELTNSYVH